MLLALFVSFVLLLRSWQSFGWWHLYKDRHQVANDCPRRQIQGNLNFTSIDDVLKWKGWKISKRGLHKPLSEDEIHKWKLWPGLMTAFDAEHGETMYGFRPAMQAIWNHQHPQDCSKAKFLIAEGFLSGFGSEIHVVGVGLALAMEMGRVFVLNPEVPPFVLACVEFHCTILGTIGQS